MLRYTLRRFLGAWPTLLILLTLAFFLMRAAPGGPFDTEKTLAPEIQANLDKKYHLDEPLIEQYGRYLFDLARGDFGPSFQYKDYTVNELIAAGFPVSLRLGGTAIILAFFIGGLFGTIAALRQNTAVDYAVMATAMTGISIPNFVLAPLMILVFAVNLQWLPAGGWNDGAFANMILPIIALTLPYVAYISRLMRSSMIEVLRSNPIRTARAKGLPEHIVILRHAMKPALLPVVSFLGPATAGILTGSVVIEQIFGIPGLGRYFVQGALNRDYTLVMGVVVFYGILIIFFNIIVDVVYALLDPKVRY
ncbi:MAG TPA: oligopeptide ABC transporter permease OppB [Gammaproteobacteria bacterium]|nr:oligopeptide transport system permease protein OppB [bacterium BMS3Abin11]GMT39343.1 MAG: peptide ABC transporter permease [bacterium]HDH17038.1 oligopeptide ABC transporter permease OppB [Gammaproteobacteria bacterium]HDZ79365.1 oligopeptide ABC transporter permease OppB [Gammaproteobacteria bacterium]